MSCARIRSARPARPAVPPLPSFDKLDVTHRRVIEVLAQLENLVGLLAEPGHEADAAGIALAACHFFNTQARGHHDAEETFVFPAVLEDGDAELRAHVLRLQQDHNWLEEDWLELEPHLQAVAQGYRKEHHHFLREALPEFTALYHAHLALEETTVYPHARRRQAARESA